MANQFWNKTFVSSVDVTQEHNHIVIRAEFDGVLFDSSEYGGDLVRWLQAVVNRSANVARGTLINLEVSK